MARIAFGIAAALALAAAPAAAQVESKCLSGKLKGSGSSAQGQLGCEAKAAAKGQAVDPACVAKSQEKLDKAFLKAEDKDDCIGLGDQTVAEILVEEFVQGLLAELNSSGVCCAVTGPACFYTADAAACAAIPGSAGAEGTVCTGAGTCAAAPAVPGSCCDDFPSIIGFIDCVNGMIDEPSCEGPGGTYSPSAICTRGGRCL